MTKNYNQNRKKIDPHVKDILTLLASGAILTASILVPPTTILYKEFEKYKRNKEYDQWQKFNLWRLKQVLKRLERQKTIEVKGDQIVITDKGKKKVLQYNLETMSLRPKTDGKWRIIMYDISNMKKQERELFRSMLKKLQLLQLQESVYLTPFVCDDEIEFLRQQFNIGNDVIVLKVVGIENEPAYKKYFGI
jgi:hypothetical protein